MDAKTFLKDEYIRASFQMFDTDGNGSIDREELLRLLSGDEFKDLYSEDQLAAVIREVDQDGDGQIDYNEFFRMMKSVD